MKKISWKKLAAVTGTCAMVVGSMPANIVLASDGDVKEITVWHYFEHEAEALEKVAEQYNESQSDVHVTCTYVFQRRINESVYNWCGFRGTSGYWYGGFSGYGILHISWCV